MSSAPDRENAVEATDELLPEYQFDYSKARPNRFAISSPTDDLPADGEPEALDSTEAAKLDVLADSFRSIIENGTASERYQYMRSTFVMLLHKVRELEKDNRWAHRKIEELGDRLAKAEKRTNA